MLLTKDIFFVSDSMIFEAFEFYPKTPEFRVILIPRSFHALASTGGTNVPFVILSEPYRTIVDRYLHHARSLLKKVRALETNS